MELVKYEDSRVIQNPTNILTHETGRTSAKRTTCSWAILEVQEGKCKFVPVLNYVLRHDGVSSA
jgi:hypothetical protein